MQYDRDTQIVQAIRSVFPPESFSPPPRAPGDYARDQEFHDKLESCERVPGGVHDLIREYFPGGRDNPDIKRLLKSKGIRS